MRVVGAVCAHESLIDSDSRCAARAGADRQGGAAPVCVLGCCRGERAVPPCAGGCVQVIVVAGYADAWRVGDKWHVGERVSCVVARLLSVFADGPAPVISSASLPRHVRSPSRVTEFEIPF